MPFLIELDYRDLTRLTGLEADATRRGHSRRLDWSLTLNSYNAHFG